MPPFYLGLAKTTWPGEGAVETRKQLAGGNLQDLGWPGSLAVTLIPPWKLIESLWSVVRRRSQNGDCLPPSGSWAEK